MSTVPKVKRTHEEALAMIGDPKVIAEKMASFRESAALFSETPLVKQYPNKWVAAFEGQIVATAETEDDLREQLDEQHIPASETLIRFISTKDRTMFL